MNCLNVVIIPQWLNLIKKELGLVDEDFADYEKLCDILSSRDLLIYQTINLPDRRNQMIKRLSGHDDAVLNDFTSPIPAPEGDSIFTLRDANIDTLAVGSTSTFKGYGSVDVRLIDRNTIGIFIGGGEEEEVSVIKQLGKVLIGRLGLQNAAKCSIFKEYVELI